MVLKYHWGPPVVALIITLYTWNYFTTLTHLCPWSILKVGFFMSWSGSTKPECNRLWQQRFSLITMITVNSLGGLSLAHDGGSESHAPCLRQTITGGPSILNPAWQLNSILVSIPMLGSDTLRCPFWGVPGSWHLSWGLGTEKVEHIIQHLTTCYKAHKGGISDTQHWLIFSIGHWYSNQNQCQSTPTLRIVCPTLDTPLQTDILFPSWHRTFPKILSRHPTLRPPFMFVCYVVIYNVICF